MRGQGEGAAGGVWEVVGRKLAGRLADVRDICAEAGSLGVAAVRVGSGSARPRPKSTADAAERPPAGSPKPRIDLTEALRAAMAASGKPAGRLLREIVALWSGPGGLTPTEYFYYRLYDDRYTDAERRRFRGRAVQLRINRRTRSPLWSLAANDKLLFDAVMRGLGYPTPEILAVYHPSRAFGRVPSLSDAAELAAFLRQGMRYPCFAKPVLGRFSYGAHAIAAVDRAADALRFWDGRSTGVDEFAGTLDRSAKGGYLFQEFREPHPAIAAICGPRLATVRLVVTFRNSVPAVFRAVWKVPVGANVADNFWRPGNILCALDPASGTVRRAIRGYGPALEELEAHPDSGARLLGFALPCWRELVALTLDAARSFAPLRLQAWDVAVCPDGPLLVELNAGGDYNLPQLATGQGVMDEAFAELLAQCGRAAYPV